ncbi:outer membrane protein assembly factor BamD [Plebeiibacterium marinum]|uniref:Outer membrane protein assembly factor BamD n=1 Tax=Plebeiibacterium marinum TaxID=2992111 RepID=A0AAE3SJV6_9BACT|nr:outer membrane protein assembly factor BamD [Plebeiobacterium marinum]MCW3804790.1 outer membrane protein assembly factor BamD [Plebeiobacterium marinum]
MKKLLILLVVIPMFIGCSQYQKILKSTDYELKYSKAMEYYGSEDFMRAATLLNELQGIYRGTEKAEVINFTYAKCLYGLSDYIMAGHYFRQFVKTFPSSDMVEECQFMSGYCYYMTSPKPRLDQTDSYEAISEFQLFVNLYPQSPRVEEANRLIDELRDKLVYKSYLSAKLYFNLGNYMGNNYLSSIIAAQNSLKEFPDTKYREELSFLILEAKYIQAENSILDKKEDRMREAIDEYYSFINEFPESGYMDKAVKIFESASKEVKFEDVN